jgi:ABC-type transporter Mla MlaB component
MGPVAARTVAIRIHGPILPRDLPGLSARVCALLGAERPGIAVCDVAGVGGDAVAVDALARLQLAAARRGCVVRLRNASGELREVVELMGLTSVLVER